MGGGNRQYILEVSASAITQMTQINSQGTAKDQNPQKLAKCCLDLLQHDHPMEKPDPNEGR